MSKTVRIQHKHLVESALRDHYPTVEVKRVNNLSTRVRIVDGRFRGLDLVERHNLVAPLLAGLPQEVTEDITVLLLLAPEEKRHSLMSAEFDEPRPSLL